MEKSNSLSYERAGVNINAGYESVNRIKPHIESTHRPGVVGGFGGFGGLFEPNLSAMKRPIAVSGTDGVGTKLKIAFIMDKHDTIGIDCVAMCVNDIACAGAEPLFFLDYLAMGKNIPSRTEQIVAGIANGCRQAGCALIGGETAEHPGMMPEDEYDLAGFSVGFVDFDKIIDGSKVKHGDIIIGLASNGLHSNGFSLVRNVLVNHLSNLNAYIPELGCTIGEELLRPTRIYVKSLLSLIEKYGSKIKGISNITGGGHYENVPRMLPDGIRAKVDSNSFSKPPIFDLISATGRIPLQEMFSTFNMGISMAMVIDEKDADDVLATLRELGETPFHIGHCVSGDKGVDIKW